MMAVLLELHYDKRDILESYLNEVFLGQDGQRAIHGFGLASQYFFSQPLAELKLDQVALLVGMVKGPSYFNPRRCPDRWRGATWCSTCSPSRAWRPSRKSTPPSSARSALPGRAAWPTALSGLPRPGQAPVAPGLPRRGPDRGRAAHLHQLRSDPAGEGRDPVNERSSASVGARESTRSRRRWS